jgi:hypothetical protein
MNQRYSKIQLKWADRKSSAETDLTLYDRTYPEALKIAKEFGYVEQAWYKPWTWNNTIFVIADY